MILDYLNMFSQAQAVTATAPSTDVIDLGPLSGGNDVRDIGLATRLSSWHKWLPLPRLAVPLL